MTWARNLALLLLVGGAFAPAFSQGSPDIEVVNLYDSNGFLPGFLIPFQLQGTTVTSGTVASFSASTATGADCRMMADPFFINTYLLKCLSSDAVTLHFSIVSGGNSYPVDYGPFNVQNPSDLNIFGGPVGDSPAAVGQALWNTYSCATCHGSSVPIPAGATAAQITAAFSTVADMTPFNFSTQLSNADVADVAAYLGTVTP